MVKYVIGFLVTVVIGGPVLIMSYLVVASLLPDNFRTPSWLAENWLIMAVFIGVMGLTALLLKFGGADILKPIAGWIPTIILLGLLIIWLGGKEVWEIGDNISKAIVEATDGDGVVLLQNDPSRLTLQEFGAYVPMREGVRVTGVLVRQSKFQVPHGRCVSGSPGSDVRHIKDEDKQTALFEPINGPVTATFWVATC